MAISQFVPEYWSAAFLRHLDAALRYAQPSVANRNWEGEINEAGDTVHIFKVDDPTVKTYVPGTDMDAPERPDGTESTLVVDQFKYFNIAIDDVNKRQALGVFPEYARRAARSIRDTVDGYVGSVIATGATSNVVGTDAAPVTVKADGSGDYTPYALAVELRRLLNGQEAPEEDRWIVINEDLEAEFLQDDKYIEVGGSETRTGQIGRIAGFEVLRTTAVPTSPGSGGAPVANSKVLGGAGNYGLTFANQLVENEAYRIERQFGDGWKGLEVYGAAVVEPESLVQAHVAD